MFQDRTTRLHSQQISFDKYPILFTFLLLAEQFLYSIVLIHQHMDFSLDVQVATQNNSPNVSWFAILHMVESKNNSNVHV
jgi:hypothetical protein